MITILRRNQRVLMLVIAILTIIAFAWLYNPATPDKLGANTVARIYGKGLSQADIEREARNFRLSLVMGQYSLISALGGMDSNEDRAVATFIWNLFVLRHESEQFGINPTDEQIADLLKKMPVFQSDGHFDIKKYEKFVEEQLGPAGFTEAQLNSVAADSLRLERVKSVISAPVAVGEGEVNDALRSFQKVDLQVVHFPVDQQKAVAVSDDEVRAVYDRKKAEFVTPETRAVKYVEFNLPPALATAQGKDKVEALQKLADAADGFSQKVTAGASFEDTAKADGLNILESPDFDQAGKTSDLAKDKAEDIKKISGSAFLLTEGSAEVVAGGDKYFVIKLTRVSPDRQLSLDEAKPFLQAGLQAEKSAKEAQVAAEALLAKLRSAVEAGQTLADAAKANGLTVELLPGIDPANMQANDKVPADFVRLSTLMEPAQLSGLLQTQQGPAALYLSARAPLTLAGDELTKQKTALTQEIGEGKRRLLFNTWLASANDAAEISVVPRGNR